MSMEKNTGAHDKELCVDCDINMYDTNTKVHTSACLFHLWLLWRYGYCDYCSQTVGSQNR